MELTSTLRGLNHLQHQILYRFSFFEILVICLLFNLNLPINYFQFLLQLLPTS